MVVSIANKKIINNQNLFLFNKNNNYVILYLYINK